MWPQKPGVVNEGAKRGVANPLLVGGGRSRGAAMVVGKRTRGCEAAESARGSYDQGEPAPASIELPLQGAGS